MFVCVCVWGGVLLISYVLNLSPFGTLYFWAVCLDRLSQLACARGLFVLRVTVSRLQLQAVATIASADSRKHVFV